MCSCCIPGEFLCSEGLHPVFRKRLHQITLPPVAPNAPFLYALPHQHLQFLVFWVIATPVLALICIFLMTSDVEHLSMYLLISISLFEDCVFRSSAPFLNRSLCKHLSFWQQQSCQPVGLPWPGSHSFSSKGLYPRVLMLGTMCLFAAGRIKLLIPNTLVHLVR